MKSLLDCQYSTSSDYWIILYWNGSLEHDINLTGAKGS
jgi:hypothetical protein